MRAMGLPLFFLILLLGGCGQKGPLFMPPPEQADKPPVAQGASTDKQGPSAENKKEEEQHLY